MSEQSDPEEEVVLIRRGKSHRRAHVLYLVEKKKARIQWVSNKRCETVHLSEITFPENDEAANPVAHSPRRSTRSEPEDPRRDGARLRDRKSSQTARAQEEQKEQQGKASPKKRASQSPKKSTSSARTRAARVWHGSPMAKAKIVEWPSSSSESEGEEREASPGRRRKSSLPQKKRKRKRVVFSQEEDNAIIRGVADWGKGNWKQIKFRSGAVLKKRSTVQIKDRYRTLTKSSAPNSPDRQDSPPQRNIAPPSGGKLSSRNHEDLRTKQYLFSDRDDFFAALEVYNRHRMVGPNELVRNGRIFVCRPVKFCHATPCNRCGATFEEGMEYLSEFRPWLKNKLCTKCMGFELKETVGVDHQSIFEELSRMRKAQDYLVAENLSRYLHVMGAHDTMLHQEVVDKIKPGPCHCSVCTCTCSYCWSTKLKM